MELLRKTSSFTKSLPDKMHIYKVYIRSVVEQSCVVWHSSLSKQNERELERVQKVAMKLIVGNDNYKESLKIANIPTLKKKHALC